MSATTAKPSGPNWRLEFDDQRIAWLCFDKVEASTNVLSGHVMVELDQRVTEIATARPRGVVLYSGKRSGFIAGADIKEFTSLTTADQAYALIRRGQQVLERLERLPCPSVAMINGFALGGGLEVALACTYRVAREDRSRPA